MEIKGDDQLSGAQQWMTKSLTEEKTMKSFSKVSVKDYLVAYEEGHKVFYRGLSDLLLLDTPLAGIVAQVSGVYTRFHGNFIEFSCWDGV